MARAAAPAHSASAVDGRTARAAPRRSGHAAAITAAPGGMAADGRTPGAAPGRSAHAAAISAAPGGMAADGRTARAGPARAAPARPAAYAERPPPYGLATHACCVWTQVAGPDGHVQRVLPDGCTDIVWIEGVRLEVAGPATAPVLVEIPPGATILGVRFGPGAAGAALGVGAHELRDTNVALDALWGAAADELVARLEEAAPPARPALLADAVARRLRDARPPDGLVAHAAALLARGMPVAQTSSEVALGARHLRRRFHDAVGYGPKTFQRILRLRRFLALAEAAPEPDLARAALDAGYSDQSHLTRECAELSGLTPAALLAARAMVDARPVAPAL